MRGRRSAAHPASLQPDSPAAFIESWGGPCGGAWSRASLRPRDGGARAASPPDTGRGNLFTVPFKAMLLGTANAGGETNLAAHRRSNLL
jgi:hypothetical protein